MNKQSKKGWYGIIAFLSIVVFPYLVTAWIQSQVTSIEEKVLIAKLSEPIMIAMAAIICLIVGIMKWNEIKKKEYTGTRKKNLSDMWTYFVFSAVCLVIFYPLYMGVINELNYFSNPKDHIQKIETSFEISRMSHSRGPDTYYATFPDVKSIKITNNKYNFLRTRIIQNTNIQDNVVYQVPKGNELIAEFLTDNQGNILEVLDLTYNYK